MRRKPKKKNKCLRSTKRPLAMAAIIAVLANAAIFLVVTMVYNSYFPRFDENEGYLINAWNPANAEYDLESKRYEFISNNGQKLVGYTYVSPEAESLKGLVIFSHGLGGGHQHYLPLIESLAKRNYIVFTYDGTGCLESEGENAVGFPQHIIDLDTAIDSVEQNKDFEGLEIALVGHSWGGYASLAVLNYHPEIKHVVSLAGFSSTGDLVSAIGRANYGPLAQPLLPYLSLLENVKFGKYANKTGVDGVRASGAKALIIATAEDEVVTANASYGIFTDQLRGDAECYLLTGRSHSYVFLTDNANKRLEEFRDYFNIVGDEVAEKYGIPEDGEFRDYPDALDELVAKVNADFSASFWNTAVDEKLVAKIDEFIAEDK